MFITKQSYGDKSSPMNTIHLITKLINLSQHKFLFIRYGLY
ncbi:hypothetical protein ABVL1U2_460035 [Acinetobacter baumannii]|nr:hypothetical protein ABVL1U2_460035 [Acinetobacter baumannii]